jgi:hypothetical protein
MDPSRSACLALLVALFSAPLARAETPSPQAQTAPPVEAETPAPPTAEEVEATFPPPAARLTVTLGGLGAAVAFYGGAAGASFAFRDAPGASDLRIPIVGPWLAIADNRCAPGDADCSDEVVALRTVLTALDGIAQVASLGIALEGLFLPTQEVAPRGPADRPTRPATPKAPEKPAPSPRDPKNLFWLPTPMAVGVRGVGVGVVGRF